MGSPHGDIGRVILILVEDFQPPTSWFGRSSILLQVRRFFPKRWVSGEAPVIKSVLRTSSKFFEHFNLIGGGPTALGPANFMKIWGHLVSQTAVRSSFWKPEEFTAFAPERAFCWCGEPPRLRTGSWFKYYFLGMSKYHIRLWKAIKPLPFLLYYFWYLLLLGGRPAWSSMSSLFSAFWIRPSTRDSRPSFMRPLLSLWIHHFIYCHCLNLSIRLTLNRNRRRILRRRKNDENC